MNKYMVQLGCTQKVLAEQTGFSRASISRYCSGIRTPASDSVQIRKLAQVFAVRAAAAGLSLSEEEIRKALNDTAQKPSAVNFSLFLEHLNQLLRILPVRISELARALNYDPSHISKILSGSRRPGNQERFVNTTIAFLAQRLTRPADLETFCRFTGVSEEALNRPEKTQQFLQTWFFSDLPAADARPVGHFLKTLNAFDLNQYMQILSFTDMPMPADKPLPPAVKQYTSITEMMEAELDFIGVTLHSSAMDDCILYSDMPMEEMTADPVFPKQWILGMAMMLKKGLHLHIIHDISRPFAEMMMGLEIYIPMYMTGQISPYYLPETQNTVFSHLLKVSGVAAMEGSAISGRLNTGRYVLYQHPDDLRHFRQFAEELLNRARPLMDIYRSARKEDYLQLMDSLWEKDPRTITCGTLPLYTMPADLLAEMLASARLPAETAAEIIANHALSRKRLERLLEQEQVHLRLPLPDAEQFAAAPPALPLSDLFIDHAIPYTYEQFLAHAEALKKLAEDHPNLHLEWEIQPVFRNLSFMVIGDQAVVVSKENAPAIHFVIRHRKMIEAFRNFTPPLVEPE
ncbi:MAG: helix-turn-helix transcriptional regulator [Solobacterium sp.]|nr:helix-turn-helix transcriptional regulator [Solobacterium sp.]